MGKSLFITEKPSVAMDYVKLLNIKGTKRDGFIESERAVFTWCVGHMVTMSYPEVYDENLKRWSLATLPFLPNSYKYEVIPAVAKQFETVRSLLDREDITTIYVCTDSGREGEYIYRLVDEMVGVKEKEKKRVWIDSQTEEEIKRGIKEAKALSEYDALASSAYLRAKEDYLLGINFSRLLTLIYGKSVASIMKDDKGVIAVGRVMSCVLGMIVVREREIRNFIKIPFFKTIGSFEVEENKVYTGEWRTTEISAYFESPLLYSESGFKRRESAEQLIGELKADGFLNEAIIQSVTKTNENKNPPLLFNLAEMQNECSKKFKINPDETLSKIQSLYEKKLVTYPRTDARVLSTSVAKQIDSNIAKLVRFQGDEEIKVIAQNILDKKWYKSIEKSKYVDDSKITDHYAIIPTGEGFENYNSLKDLDKDIYNLILRRFLAIFYPPAKYSKLTIITKQGNECFFTTDKVCTSKGYLEVSKSETNQTEEKELSFLNNLKKGQKVKLNELIIKEGETSPPKKYTSGSIILAMENAGKLIEDEELREQIKGSGIGTSATRAEILKKLEKIEYISTNKKTQILSPTTRGEMVYEVIKDSVPTMLNPTLTASWEKGLGMVADRELPPEEFMIKLETYIKNNFTRALKHNGVIETKKLFGEVFKDTEMIIDESGNNVPGTCPFCKKGHIIKSKKGYGCTNWQSGCKFFVSEICGIAIPVDQIKNLLKYGKTEIISGFKSKKGNEFSARLVLKDNKIELDFQ
ncbi:MAG: topoisomerase C-terminal repeat-containing protein [Clostridiaceae bacterium]|nr:topoisomerase C-terminal repeat-containing protein [Clostridiaceae bacterium]